MKLLLMQPAPRSRRLLNRRAQRHFAALHLAAAFLLAATITVVVLAIAVTAALVLVALSLAALIFMAVNPSGNLLLLILLTHLWLLYGRPEPETVHDPGGRHTMKRGQDERASRSRGLAA